MPGFAVVLLLLSASAAAARPAADPDVSSARQARAAVERGLAALGGEEAARRAALVSIRYEGDVVHRHQSRRPEPPYQRSRMSGLLVQDVDGRRFSHELDFGYLGGFRNHTRVVTNGKEAWSVNFVDRRKTSLGAPSAGQLMNFHRWLPHLLLLDALDRPSQLRHLGRSRHSGREVELVSWPTQDGPNITLAFDSKTHRLHSISFVLTDPFLGDAAYERIFPDYRSVGGVWMPTGRISRQGGETVEELSFVEVGRPSAVSFEKPADFEIFPSAPAITPSIVELAPGVFLHRAAYNSLFVDLGDSLLAVESPGDDSVSRAAIVRMKEKFPAKPISTVVVTHHHQDHAGGVRGYLAEGADLLTTPGNVAFFQTVSRAEFHVEPDGLSRRPRSRQVRAVRGRQEISGGGRTVVLYDIGPNPHTEEMLVAWLPAEKILFEGDLLNRPQDGHASPGNDTTAFFADWIEKNGLAVEKIVPVHGVPSTPDDLREAVRLFESRRGRRGGREPSDPRERDGRGTPRSTGTGNEGETSRPGKIQRPTISVARGERARARSRRAAPGRRGSTASP